MKIPIKIVAFVFALAAAVAVWIYLGPDLSKAKPTGGSVAGPQAEDSSASGGVFDSSAGGVRRNTSAQGEVVGNFFVQLEAEAEQGSAIAQRRLAEVYGMCVGYSLNPATQLATLDNLARLAPDSSASIQKVKKRLVARCSQVDLGKPIPMEAAELWTLEAARNGDAAAMVRLRISSMDPLSAAEVSQFIDKVVESQDPDAMLELSNLILRPIEGEVDKRYAKIAGSQIAGAAWGISACRSGAACGSGLMLMDSICMHTGKCNYNSYEEFVMAELVPPGERQRLSGMVGEILSLFHRP